MSTSELSILDRARAAREQSIADSNKYRADQETQAAERSARDLKEHLRFIGIDANPTSGSIEIEGIPFSVRRNEYGVDLSVHRYCDKCERLIGRGHVNTIGEVADAVDEIQQHICPEKIPVKPATAESWRFANGGSAFPHTSETADGIWSGLYKRDYFAAAALQGMLPKYEINQHDDFIAAADLAYKFADAMLRAREGK